MRVLLADRHSRVRWALRTAIREVPGLTVIGEVAVAGSLLSEAQHLRCDLILLEWELAGHPVGDLVAALCGSEPPPQVIVLGQRADQELAALAAGATAFVSKADGPEPLLAALRSLVGESD